MELHYCSSRKFSVLKVPSALWVNEEDSKFLVKNRTTDKGFEKTLTVLRLEAKSVEDDWEWLLCLWQCEEKGASLGDGRGEKRKEKD